MTPPKLTEVLLVEAPRDDLEVLGDMLEERRWGANSPFSSKQACPPKYFKDLREALGRGDPRDPVLFNIMMACANPDGLGGRLWLFSEIDEATAEDSLSGESYEEDDDPDYGLLGWFDPREKHPGGRWFSSLVENDNGLPSELWRQPPAEIIYVVESQKYAVLANTSYNERYWSNDNGLFKRLKNTIGLDEHARLYSEDDRRKVSPYDLHDEFRHVLGEVARSVGGLFLKKF